MTRINEMRTSPVIALSIEDHAGEKTSPLMTPIYPSGGFIGVISKLTPQNHAVEGFYRLMAENDSFIRVLP